MDSIEEMTTSQIITKMIRYSGTNRHDIAHFMKVYAYARTIAECEGLSPRLRKIVETAAIIHDIACPLCREKYGNTNGKHQEREGTVLAEAFLEDTGLPDDMVRRIVFLVGHHHTPQAADGPDYQILLEADYLVNADESDYPAEQLQTAGARLFKTSAGTALFHSIYADKLR